MVIVLAIGEAELRRVAHPVELAVPCIAESPTLLPLAAWPGDAMDLFRDVRLTVRDLLRHPGYTTAIIVSLALAVAANSAIFSAIYAVLLKPSAFLQPENLVICWARDPVGSPVIELSYRNFEDWAAHSRSLSQVAAVGSSTWPVILEARGDSSRLASAGVSSSLFDTLGVRPEIGRAFRPADDVPNAPRVVILSHAVWANRFGADPGIVGKTVQLGEPHTIVGVMPQGFDFPRGTDVWLPVVPILANAGNEQVPSPLENVGVLFVIGRLRNGVTPSMAADDLDRVSAGSRAQRFGTSVVVTPLLNYVMGPVRQALWALFAAVGILLLIACANVSGLMLTRVSLRRREHAVRVALGAGRVHVARQWAVEALLLSAAGGCLGLLASHWIARALVALAPQEIPRLSDVSINLPVAAFTFIVVVTTALLCGVQPIRHASRLDVVEALNESARATPGRQALRTRSVLLVFQIGLTIVLLIAAGLLVRSFVQLRRIDLGFVSSNVVTMNVAPHDPGPSMNEWMHRLLLRATSLPDVEAAGAVYLRPLALGPIGEDTRVILDGQPDTPESARLNPTLNYQVATPGYFSAMRIQLKRGRLLTDQDTLTSPRVVLVGESTARRLWGGADPIGKRILMPTQTADGGPNVWRTVVGVVSDVHYRGIDDVRLDVYDAALQASTAAADLVIRTSGNPLAAAAAVQAEARRLDPLVVIDRVTTMDAIVSRAIAPWRFSMWMFTVFALFAFALATVGLLSLTSLDVANRRHEFAVRLALGAQRADITRAVLWSALRRVLPGVTLGLLAAAAGAGAIRHMLFGVGPLDSATYAAVLLLVVAVVTGASWVPAHRASRVDPLVLLRRE